jgi:hypothetical protein
MEFFGPLIAQIPSAAPGDRRLIRPERGSRLVLVHRPEGVMGYTHSHRCWVGIAPVRGVETHQRWDAARHQDGRAELRLADERALVPGDVVTLVPPRDVHNHAHVADTGPSPYSLILLGDDMLVFDREEYDPEQGTWRALAPGDADLLIGYLRSQGPGDVQAQGGNRLHNRQNPVIQRKGLEDPASYLHPQAGQPHRAPKDLH